MQSVKTNMFDLCVDVKTTAAFYCVVKGLNAVRFFVFSKCEGATIAMDFNMYGKFPKPMSTNVVTCFAL